jgi:hypothetical protein
VINGIVCRATQQYNIRVQDATNAQNFAFSTPFQITCSSTCQHGGRCNATTLACDCTPGYSGFVCESGPLLGQVRVTDVSAGVKRIDWWGDSSYAVMIKVCAFLLSSVLPCSLASKCVCVLSLIGFVLSFSRLPLVSVVPQRRAPAFGFPV